VNVTIYTRGDDPSFRFQLQSSDVTKWIESCKEEWLRAMKERDVEIYRRDRIMKFGKGKK
jgi:hypothetical protein